MAKNISPPRPLTFLNMRVARLRLARLQVASLIAFASAVPFPIHASANAAKGTEASPSKEFGSSPSKAIAKTIGISLYELAKSVASKSDLRKTIVAGIAPQDETEAFTRLQNQLQERDDLCAVPGAKKLNCQKDMANSRESVHILLSARQRYVENHNTATDATGSSYLWIVYVQQVKAERLVFEPWIKSWSHRCENSKMRFNPNCNDEKKLFGKSYDDLIALTAAFEAATKKGQATVAGIEKKYEAYRD